MNLNKKKTAKPVEPTAATAEGVLMSNEFIARLIERLPTSWDNFKMGDYMKTIDLPITEASDTDLTDRQFTGVDNTLKVIAVLLDLNLEYLQSKAPLALVKIMSDRLAFMVKPVPKVEAKPWFKSLEECTYNDFVEVVSLAKDPVHNMRQALIRLSKEPLTMDQVNEMSVTEVHAAFFTLRRYTLKFLRRSAQKEARNLVKIMTRQARQALRRSRKN